MLKITALTLAWIALACLIGWVKQTTCGDKGTITKKEEKNGQIHPNLLLVRENHKD